MQSRPPCCPPAAPQAPPPCAGGGGVGWPPACVGDGVAEAVGSPQRVRTAPPRAQPCPAPHSAPSSRGCLAARGAWGRHLSSAAPARTHACMHARARTRMLRVPESHSRPPRSSSHRTDLQGKTVKQLMSLVSGVDGAGRGKARVRSCGAGLGAALLACVRACAWKTRGRAGAGNRGWLGRPRVHLLPLSRAHLRPCYCSRACAPCAPSGRVHRAGQPPAPTAPVWVRAANRHLLLLQLLKVVLRELKGYDLVPP